MQSATDLVAASQLTLEGLQKAKCQNSMLIS